MATPGIVGVAVVTVGVVTITAEAQVLEVGPTTL